MCATGSMPWRFHSRVDSTKMKCGQNSRQHLVVVGGGVADLQITSTLARRYGDSTNVSMIDRELVHMWKPMLHEFAAGTSSSEQQSTTFIDQAAKQGFEFVYGSLESIDRKSQSLSISAVVGDSGRSVLPARHLKYDYLVLAMGSRTHDFGIPRGQLGNY